MSKSIQIAKNFCEKNKYRFTKPREQVLQTIYNQDTPLSAYDILEILSAKKQTNPPTVYRAIDFWLKHGFIHRIESQNCYVKCKENHKHQGFEVFVCQNCGFVDESHFCNLDIFKEFQKLTPYQIDSWNLELRGLCDKCLNKC
ncbi:Fur family transcriptional regulator [Francisella orientalis]|uniref:Fe2+/Zn2+ uptake regulator protein n=1 Tax=Francisella orientalis TaxID=299583 RepID=A0AAP6XB91_9GAMM|nr:Fur family transcriptional regulator [Francisella orientalis]AFJ43942.1 regulatory protein [Francisella orientalis str. Toba 04]AKN85632.1 Fe2+/Zn2+ uptake regulator protein [Francisella orientalis FNO12]AKN87172.1 Fe2+/Zn2+ uptake regulator protein [Francisella orientalis FNO24]AKN88709.1 Fe2+/Zn2+ uptake regulator protein [Francisella orientalis]AKU05467.1 Fe2+/Zn2+ uptake regulator protein [Francisella orientalis]